MDVNYRAALLLGKVREPPCGTPPPFKRVANKEALVPDSSIWFTKLSTGQTRQGYPTDEPVFSQGDPANAVFYIQSGKVRLTVQSDDGEQAVLSILAAGSFFGECCLAGQAIRSATASALLPSTIVRIEKQVTLDLLRSDPEFAERFRTYMLSRSICMEADLVSHLLDSRENRLARMRGVESKCCTGWKPIPVAANMSPESLAKIIGTTSSNVSFILDGFRELGFIDSSGGEMRVHGSLMSIVQHDGHPC
jgi:CRP/FNR family transcriptional regulator, cyclic AMP receptor protein